MSDLPKCKLCGSPALKWSAGWTPARRLAQCPHSKCVMSGVVLTQSEWRALMSPPAVTGAMVERGARAMMGSMPWAARDISRAVLDAAMRE